jgi:predicted outer membrane repeat protein
MKRLIRFLSILVAAGMLALGTIGARAQTTMAFTVHSEEEFAQAVAAINADTHSDCYIIRVAQDFSLSGHYSLLGPQGSGQTDMRTIIITAADGLDRDPVIQLEADAGFTTHRQLTLILQQVVFDGGGTAVSHTRDAFCLHGKMEINGATLRQFHSVSAGENGGIRLITLLYDSTDNTPYTPVLTLYDGAILNNSNFTTASPAFGGAIYADSSSTVNLFGGVVSGNTVGSSAAPTALDSVSGQANAFGGAVACSGDLCLKNVTIQDNQAGSHRSHSTGDHSSSTGCGGALAVFSQTTGRRARLIAFSGDYTVIGNQAARAGGDAVSAAQIAGLNGELARGGAIYIGENASASLGAGTFASNRADDLGGAIYSAASYDPETDTPHMGAQLLGALIYGNRADQFGGGVWIGHDGKALFFRNQDTGALLYQNHTVDQSPAGAGDDLAVCPTSAATYYILPTASWIEGYTGNPFDNHWGRDGAMATGEDGWLTATGAPRYANDGRIYTAEQLSEQLCGPRGFKNVLDFSFSTISGHAAMLLLDNQAFAGGAVACEGYIEFGAEPMVRLLGQKVVTQSGDESIPLPAGSFTFQLASQPTFEDGTILQTKNNDADGYFQFDPLKIDGAQPDQTYYYYVREVSGDNPLLRYDPTIYQIAVGITIDEQHGTLSTSYSVAAFNGNIIGIPTSPDFRFINRLADNVEGLPTLELSGVKTIDGDPIINDGENVRFAFRLSQDDGSVIQTVSNEEDYDDGTYGAIRFTPLVFTDEGTYHLTVTEVRKNDTTTRTTPLRIDPRCYFLTVTVSDLNAPPQLTVEFDGQPVTDGISTDGHTTAFSALNFNNTTPQTRDIVVTKQWLGPVGESAEIVVTSGDTEVGRYTLTAADQISATVWQHTFTGLPTKDENGLIPYTVCEESLHYDGTDYQSADDGTAGRYQITLVADGQLISGNSAEVPVDGRITIQNYDATTVTVVVKKTWIPQLESNDDAPAVSIMLNSTTTDTNFESYPTPLPADDWEYTYSEEEGESLPKYDPQTGSPIAYSVTEGILEGGVFYPGPPSGYRFAQTSQWENDTLTVSLTNYRSADVALSVTKNWEETPGDSALMQVWATTAADPQDSDWQLVDTWRFTAGNTDNWTASTHTFTLPEKDIRQQTIRYKVDESAMAGYTPIITKDSTGWAWTITNQKIVTTSLTYRSNPPAGSGLAEQTMNHTVGGSADLDPQAALTLYSLSQCGFPVPQGYYFAGWNTAADGSGTAYAPGAAATAQQLNTTVLYACWAAQSPLTITITGSSATVPYDGQPHTNRQYTVAYRLADGSAALPAGLTLDQTAAQAKAAAGTDAGTYSMGLTAADFAVRGLQADHYAVAITVTDATLTIRPRAVVLTSASAQKRYDGTPLTADALTIGGEGFIAGEGVTVASTASLRDAGSIENTFTFAFNEGTKALNYRITAVTGTLTVTPRTVTLTSASAEKRYDGTPLTADAVTIGGEGFIAGEGARFTVTGTITAPGSAPNTFRYQLTDGTKAENYTIRTVAGTLTVTAAQQPDTGDPQDLSGWRLILGLTGLAALLTILTAAVQRHSEKRRP